MKAPIAQAAAEATSPPGCAFLFLGPQNRKIHLKQFQEFDKFMKESASDSFKITQNFNSNKFLFKQHRDYFDYTNMNIFQNQMNIRSIVIENILIILFGDHPVECTEIVLKSKKPINILSTYQETTKLSSLISQLIERLQGGVGIWCCSKRIWHTGGN
jgi:hypothetical protein